LLKQKSKENLESKSPLLGRGFRRGKKVLSLGEDLGEEKSPPIWKGFKMALNKQQTNFDLHGCIKE
jgi:hypothetical protein